MPAYLIVDIEVHDPERHEAYRAAGPATLERFGGRLIVKGGDFAVLEGNWQPKRLVMAEFPDLESAKRWYESPEYREAKKLREGTATLQMVAVDGID
jgi:uncharacterized protein (DUF1330 family)